jgi:hypothetical protein
MESSAKILVIVMHSNEAEFEFCLETISRQTLPVTIQTISGLSNFEAHSKLYQIIMEQEKNFDFFIKCDADMILKSELSVEKILAEFAKHPEVNHHCFEVFDWFSNEPIIGLHAFRSGVQWNMELDPLLLDPNPINARSRYVRGEEPSPIAYHVYSPSPYQAFYFGLHRALKVRRPQERFINVRTSWGHYMTLYRTLQNFLRKSDKRLGLALLGMVEGLSPGLKDVQLKKSDYEQKYKAYESLDIQEVATLISKSVPSTYYGWVINYFTVIGTGRIINSILIRGWKKARIS